MPHISPHLKPPHPDLKKPDTDRFYFPAHSGEIVDTLTGVVYPSNAIPDDSLFWLHVYKEDVIVKRPWLQGVSTTLKKHGVRYSSLVMLPALGSSSLPEIQVIT